MSPESYHQATVLCTELFGFSDFVESYNPVYVFGFLQHLHGVFDDALLEFDVYKVGVFGDRYVVC